jgi:hypothetical protein
MAPPLMAITGGRAPIVIGLIDGPAASASSKQ